MGNKAFDTIKRRGRWDSDIYKIYTRSLVSDQLDMSGRAMDADGLDLETACVGWTQPR